MIMSGTINLERMKTYTSGNDVLVKKLLQSFVNNIPGQLDQLKDSLLSNDLNGVRELAHKLKTPFLYIGSDDIAKKLANIEDNFAAMDNSILLQDINWIVNMGNNCVGDARRLLEK